MTTPLFLHVTHTFTFEGQLLRVMMIDNHPWFVVADIAKVLQFRSGSVIRRIPTEDRQRVYLHNTTASMYWNLVNTRGFLLLVSRSPKPQAPALLAWAETVMLPALRQQGAQGTQLTMPAPVDTVAQTFTFAGHDIRVVLRDTQPWVLLSDLCRAVGLPPTNKGGHLLQHLAADATQCVVLHYTSPPRRHRLVTVPGMLTIVSASVKPRARAFHQWITQVLCPALGIVADALPPVEAPQLRTPVIVNAHAVRVVQHGGVRWCVAKDLYAALGKSHTNSHLYRLRADEKTEARLSTPHGDRVIALVNAAGLRRLVQRWETPDAYAVQEALMPSTEAHALPADDTSSLPAVVPVSDASATVSAPAETSGAPVSLQLHEQTDGTTMVSARELWDGLGSKRDFSAWLTHNIFDNPLLTEGIEYSPHCGENPSGPSGGRPKTDYLITLDLAKHITLQSRTEIGRQYRHYLIEVEQRVTNDVREAALQGVMDRQLSPPALESVVTRVAALETVVTRLVATLGT